MYAHFKGGYLSSATRPVDVNAKHTHDHLHSSEHDLGQQDPCRRSSKLQDSSKLLRDFFFKATVDRREDF